MRDLRDSAQGGPGSGCTVWSFTALGECGLNLSLGLRPMKTLSSIQVRGS